MSIARTLWRTCGVAVMGLAMVACTTYPDAPAEPAGGDDIYIIGPLDQLEIFVWGDTELSRQVIVRPDGRLSTPLIQDMLAAGKTPSELSDDLADALTPYIQEPLVTVIVNGFSGPVDRQVRVVGAVNAPTDLPYRRDLTVLDVMLDVGGLTEFADGNAAILIRGEGEARKTYRVRLDDLLKDSDIDANVAVLPGDIIMVPEALL